MKTKRKQLINWLFKITSKLYTRIYKKHEPWNITKKELLSYPTNTIGYALGKFLQQNNFELIPKVERHDCYHVVTGYSTKVEDEIALQYLSLGNGKRSPYLFGAIILGTLILPDYLYYYVKSYRLGKSANVFHSLNYKLLLKVDLEEFKTTIFLKQKLRSITKYRYEKI